MTTEPRDAGTPRADMPSTNAPAAQVGDTAVARCSMSGMRYVMRQKIWSWGDDFVIKDEGGVDRFDDLTAGQHNAFVDFRLGEIDEDHEERNELKNHIDERRGIGLFDFSRA